MTAFTNQIIRVGLILAAFAIGVTVLVAVTEKNTRQQIKDNERAALLAAIGEVINANEFNNNILTDTLQLPALDLLGTNEPTTVYRARMNEQPVAAILTSIAPNGYSGSIIMLVGIYYDGSLAGVRVVSHKETPGLGDKVDVKRSDWILNFKGKSLTQPVADKWKVKKDGGEFDQFTGATITPRAVVQAIKQSLLYFDKHRDELFAPTEVK